MVAKSSVRRSNRTTKYVGHSLCLDHQPGGLGTFGQPAFLEFGDGRDPVTMTFPVVVGRPGHPGDVTDALHGEPLGLLLVDEAVEHHSLLSRTGAPFRLSVEQLPSPDTRVDALRWSVL